MVYRRTVPSDTNQRFFIVDQCCILHVHRTILEYVFNSRLFISFFCTQTRPPPFVCVGGDKHTQYTTLSIQIHSAPQCRWMYPDRAIETCRLGASYVCVYVFFCRGWYVYFVCVCVLKCECSPQATSWLAVDSV